MDLELGIPSKRDSSNRADYVPAKCTHRPSLLPMSVQVSLLDSVKLNIKQTLALRGKRSRNKVSVGEPAEGSFIIYVMFFYNLSPLLGNQLVYLFQVFTVNKLKDIIKFSTMDI